MAKTWGNKLCDYGCGQEAHYQFKNGKVCCSKTFHKCPMHKRKIKEASLKQWNNEKSKKKILNSIRSEKSRKKISKASKKMWGKKEHRDKIKNIYANKDYKEKVKKREKEKWADPIFKKKMIKIFRSDEVKNKQSQKAIKRWKTPEYRNLMNIVLKEHKKYLPILARRTIKKIQKKYPTFSKVEEMQYDPDKPDEKEIQVHCKNHNCKNSKEKDGWFTPTGRQIEQRVTALEHITGNDGCYFYCSDKCKKECPLYNLKSDPFKENKKIYNQEEYQTFRTFVLKRDNYICQYCGEKAEHVHHERPQKLEPFFSLDPDYAWSCCEKCHYEKGHKDECSTGNLAKIQCL